MIGNNSICLLRPNGFKECIEFFLGKTFFDQQKIVLIAAVFQPQIGGRFRKEHTGVGNVLKIIAEAFLHKLELVRCHIPDQISNVTQNLVAVSRGQDDFMIEEIQLTGDHKGIALRGNDGDPEHNFFIGLAYLGGIDVEKDYDTALEMISGAAEEGLPEAMEKLVSMYREGEGTARDYDKAIAWQEKLAERYKSIFAETKSENDALRYIDTLWNLGNYVYEKRDIAKAKEIYGEMLSETLSINESFDFVWAKRALSVSYDNLGDIAEAEGSLTEAKRYYALFLEIAEEIAAIRTSR